MCFRSLTANEREGGGGALGIGLEGGVGLCYVMIHDVCFPSFTYNTSPVNGGKATGPQELEGFRAKPIHRHIKHGTPETCQSPTGNAHIVHNPYL